MKKRKYIYITFSLLLMVVTFSLTYAYEPCGVLNSQSDSVVGATMSGLTWTDTGATVPVDLNGYTGDVFVIAAVQSSATGKMTGSWQLTDGSTTSRSISRYLSSGSDYGQATVSHIFSGLSGNPTFQLQHRTDDLTDDLMTTAELVAIPLVSDVGKLLPHDSVNTTTVFSYDEITYATITDTIVAVTLPMSGNVYLAASFNSSSGNVGVGEWKMQYRLVNGIWTDVGWATQRKHGSEADTGAVSLTALAENLPEGDYEFSLAMRTGGKLVNTFDVTFSAIGLMWYETNTEYGFFPSAVGHVDTVKVGTANQKETAVSIPHTIDIASDMQVFMGSHYQMEGNSTVKLDTAVNSAIPYASQELLRTLSNATDIGNGGAVGLSGSLLAESNHNMDLRFEGSNTQATLVNPVLVMVGMSCRTDAPLAISLAEIDGATTAVSPIVYIVIAIVLMLFTLVLLRRWGGKNDRL